MPVTNVQSATPYRLGIRRVRDFSQQKLLGQGGMALVHSERGRCGQEIAVKTSVFSTPLGEFCIRNEAQALSRLQHPNIIGYVGHGETDKGPFLAMEKFDGESLDKYLARRSGIHVLEALELTRKISLGVAHMHDRGLVHVDLKPANVLINRQGLKLIDLAFARPEGKWLEIEKDQGSGHFVCATPAYLLPDRLTLDRPPERRDDLAALGFMLFRMLTGKKALPMAPALPIQEALEKAYRELGSRISALRVPEAVKNLLFRMTGVYSITSFADCHGVIKSIDGITARPAPVFSPAPSLALG